MDSPPCRWIDGHENRDSGFQYLENIATAYWYSEVLFAALDLGLFDRLANGAQRLERLAGETGCKPEALVRFLEVLQGLDLVHHSQGRWRNSQAAAQFLVAGSPAYMGNFLGYRRYMKTGWQGILATLSERPPTARAALSRDDDYARRTEAYVRAMDELARIKAEEIVRLLGADSWRPPVLDVGGGAGSLARALIRIKTEGEAVLLDLPEVIRAARQLYPERDAWRHIRTIEGDFRTWRGDRQAPFGLVALGNFLHTYSAQEARILLEKALGCLSADGLLLIHDYFPDRPGRSPHKGVLYDLNMMLNTYNGACHRASTLKAWLEEAGIAPIRILDLSTDSAILVAGGRTTN